MITIELNCNDAFFLLTAIWIPQLKEKKNLFYFAKKKKKNKAITKVKDTLPSIYILYSSEELHFFPCPIQLSQSLIFLIRKLIKIQVT